jgi:hypothetical protein
MTAPEPFAKLNQTLDHGAPSRHALRGRSGTRGDRQKAGTGATGRMRQDRSCATRPRRNGGRPYAMTPAKLGPALAAMVERDTKVGDLCKELGVTRRTLNRLRRPERRTATRWREAS